MRVAYISLILIFCWTFQSNASALILNQDSLNLKSPQKTTWEIGLGSFYQLGSPSFKDYFRVEPIPILLPNDPSLQRRRFDSDLREKWELDKNYSTDHTLFHLPYYIDFYVKQEIADWVDLDLRAIVEHRGFSYGLGNTKNIALLPQARMNLKKNFILKSKDTVFFKAQIGNFNNFESGERLYLYNLDILGNVVNLKYKSWNFELVGIGDLHRNIGLNIYDALFSSIYQIKDVGNNKIKYGFTHGFLSTGLPFDYHNFDLNAAYFNTDKFRIYAQGSIRQSSLFIHKNAPIESLFAGVIGFKFNNKWNKQELFTRLEARYFGDFYNSLLINQDVYYRERADHYGNTVGEQLYPLYRYDRPHGQWALYTMYYGQKLWAGSFELNYMYSILSYLKLRINLDMHLLIPQRLNVFSYGLYEIGAQIQLPQNYQIFMGLSNKGMNLDIHFPTHYVYLEPVLQIKLAKDIAAFNRSR